MMTTREFTGVGRANQLLQDSGGDLVRYAAARMEFYCGLKTFGHFGAAWTRRVADVLKQ